MGLRLRRPEVRRAPARGGPGERRRRSAAFWRIIFGILVAAIISLLAAGDGTGDSALPDC